MKFRPPDNDVPNSPEDKTEPGVFIIESLDFDDEQAGRFEGRILRDMLKLSEKKVEYWYVRTWKELKQDIFKRFRDSGLRYLHLSCHGHPDHISLTLDDVAFEEFGPELSPYLAKRRLFVSACEVVNEAFAAAVNASNECYSVIGPDEDIRFDDAAVMWVSFYHLMLKDANAMKSHEIKKVITKLKNTFGVRFRYF
jgi:hypothetical protein